ncbi:MAG TPA: aldo/keto reductase [Candidatus Saccharimonadales bacterium]|nr:aldo/keto reductase [Candidatus Saccharimonadales bacterium]
MQLHGIGLGTFPFSNVFGKVSAQEAGVITQKYLVSGGEYIQTSPYYDGVEPLLGDILGEVPRNSYKIATLCVKDKNSQLAGNYDAVITQCDESLSRLRLDYVDLLMTSTPEATDAPFSEAIRAMQTLKQQGKVKAIGVCNVTLDQLKEYNATGDVEYVQNRLSLIDQDADRDVRAYCVEKGIGLIPYNVIEWGLLTNKMLGTWELRKGDLRTKVLPVFDEKQKTMLHEWVVAELKPIADAHQTSIEALAIAWALQQPGVVTCPVGATNETQIASSLQAEQLIGKAEMLDALNAAYETLAKTVGERTGQTLNTFLRNSYGTW